MTNITVTGTYGGGASGTVIFTPVVTQLDGTVIILADPVTGKVIAGSLSKAILTSDSYDVEGAVTYKVVEKVGSTGRTRFWIYVPSSLGVTVDLSDLIHFSSPPNQLQIDEGAVVDFTTHLATDHAPLEADIAALETEVDGKVSTAIVDAKGDLLAATAADALTRLGVGTNGQVLTADSAEATGMKWAVAASPSSIPATIIDAKGDLISATAADTPVRVAVGTNNQVLIADSAQASGLRWGSPTNVIPNTIVDVKGDLIAASAADTVVRVAVGANGQILTADSTQASGLSWTNPATSGIPAGIVDAKGDIIAATGADVVVRFPVGSNDNILIADSTTATGLRWGTVPTAIPATIADAKGDIIAATAADTFTRVAVGTNGQILTADSTQASGMRWGTDAAGIMATIVDAKGDIIAATAADTVARLAVSATQGHVLKVNSATATGLEWGAVPADATKANVSGNLTQFADVSDTTPLDQQVLRYNGGTNLYTPFYLDTLFAEIGSDGRIVTSAEPQWYVPIVIIDEGGSPPPAFPVGGIVFSRPAAASIVPVHIGSAEGVNVTTRTVTTTSEVAVGDYLIYQVMFSGEAGTPITLSMAYDVGVAPVTQAVTHTQGTTVQMIQSHARCTTTIPAGTDIDITLSATRQHVAISVQKVANLVTVSPVDDTATGGAASSGNMTLTIAGLTTTTANQVAFATYGFNHGTQPIPQRTLAGLDDWIAVGPAIYSDLPAGNFRAMGAFYKILGVAAGYDPTVQMTSSDAVPPTTGVWGGVAMAMKGA